LALTAGNLEQLKVVQNNMVI